MKALALSLAALAVAVVVGLTSTGTSEAATATSIDSDAAAPAVSSSIWSDWEQQVLTLHNQARGRKRAALTASDALGQAADRRCVEITQKFSHTRPSGKAWYTVFREFGVSYRAAGENIAWGQGSPTAVHNAWMNSSGHKANIMNRSFKQAGVGHCLKGTANYWVVLFKG